MAYKDIDRVMEAQRDLVEVLHTLRQVVCVKGLTGALWRPLRKIEMNGRTPSAPRRHARAGTG